MKSYIPKMIAAAGLYLTTLLGGCGPDYEYRFYEDVKEADGFDVQMNVHDDYLELWVGEFNKTKGQFDSEVIYSLDKGSDCNIEDVFDNTVTPGSRLDKLNNKLTLNELCSKAKASKKGVRVDFGK